MRKNPIMPQSRFLAFLIKEFREVVPPTLFFGVGFNLIVLTTKLILADYKVQFANFMVATMLALVVAKSVLVANALQFLRHFDRHPKIRPADTTEEQYDKVLAINLKSAFFGTQLAARQMIKQGDGGRIINITSVHEDWPMPGNPAYCLSKGGMRMLTRTAGVELAPHKILVVGVGPGAVATPIIFRP
jgi:NAD(P)-dependent dehydrogenase (short-subunit alcohol dehydrogenase family)